MGLLDYADEARNKLKGLLGEMPIARMMRDGVLSPTGNGLRDALYAMPKPFDANDQAANDVAMAFWNPAGLLGKIVYHGSPHKFDKFDASKIGTGEGAQAYGHGVYLADSPEVAKQYKADRSYVGKAMSGAPVTNDWGPDWIAKNAIDIHGDKATDHLRGVLEQNKSLKASGQAAENAKVTEAIGLIQSGKVAPSGSLYKADLPDEWIPKMLDWDKPLKEQPEVVRKKLAPLVQRSIDEGFTTLKSVDKATGDDVYGALRDEAVGWKTGGWDRGIKPEHEQAYASRRLQELGIPGIKYLDGGSRGKGQGSYNYVVFPGLEDQVKILERNGKGLLDF